MNSGMYSSVEAVPAGTDALRRPARGRPRQLAVAAPGRAPVTGSPAVIRQAAGSERRRDAAGLFRQRVDCAVIEHLVVGGGVRAGHQLCLGQRRQRGRLVADLASLTAWCIAAVMVAVLSRIQLVR